MTSIQKKRIIAEWVCDALNRLYPTPEVPLVHNDPYTLLIAVLLSAQTTDKRVNLVTPTLFETAPTPYEMVKLSPEKILSIIRTCGLAPKKAAAIHELSKILIQKYQGNVPNTFEALEELPGVGHKTASVVMSQAFGVEAFPVDTHIHRLAKRWKLSNGKSVEKTEADLKSIFPKEIWNKLHLQIIYYGREYCTARGCDGSSCPICKKIKSL